MLETAVLALLLAGAAAADGPCTGIEVRSGGILFADGFESGDTSAWGSTDPRFSARQVLDLDLETRFAEGFEGDHLLHLKLTTPKGHHYQTLDLPITTAAALRGTEPRVDGYPRPLAVRVAEAAGTSPPSVVAALPVGGTVIVASSLYGLWTVEATLDDEAVACVTAQFVLYP